MKFVSLVKFVFLVNLLLIILENKRNYLTSIDMCYIMMFRLITDGIYDGWFMRLVSYSLGV